MPTGMKIGVVAPAFPPVVGGAETLVANLTEALTRLDVAVFVLTASEPSPRVAAAVRASGGVVALPRPARPGRLPWEHEAFSKAEALERLLDEHGLDLVHAFSYDAAITAAIVCPPGDPARVPVVATCSEMTTPQRARIEHLRARFVFSLDALDRYIAISDMYAGLARAHGLPAHKLRVNKGGIDVGRFAAGSARRGRDRLGIDDRALLVTCPSRFSRRKGQLDLLRAVELLDPPPAGLRLLLAGSINSAYQEHLDAIRAAVRAPRLRGIVQVIEDLPHQDMPDLLAASDLVVLPSHHEGLGLAALEAMAAGSCALLTDTAGLNEVADHDHTAYYVPPRNPDALAGALSKLLADPGLRQRLAEAGRAHVKDHFSIDATARRMVEHYDALLAEHGRTSPAARAARRVTARRVTARQEPTDTVDERRGDAMSDAENPRFAAPELESLCDVLDAHRDKIVKAMSGLSDDDLRRPMVPSGTSLLGIVKHLGYIERFWFQIVFAGLDVPLAYTDEDPKAEWRIEPDETTDAVIAFYKGEAARARELIAGATPETRASGTLKTSRGPASQFALRWILLHMIEETAQHNGHADILRELLGAEGAQG